MLLPCSICGHEAVGVFDHEKDGTWNRDLLCEEHKPPRILPSVTIEGWNALVYAEQCWCRLRGLAITCCPVHGVSVSLFSWLPYRNTFNPMDNK